jgi:hypothetical protein
VIFFGRGEKSPGIRASRYITAIQEANLPDLPEAIGTLGVDEANHYFGLQQAP